MFHVMVPSAHALICMYVGPYVCTVRVCVRVSVSIDVYASVCAYVCTYTCVHVRTYYVYTRT